MRALFTSLLQRGRIVTAGALLMVASLPQTVAARGLPTTTPEDVGLSSERLNRIMETFQKEVDTSLDFHGTGFD
jgi:hypothetical protein